MHSCILNKILSNICLSSKARQFLPARWTLFHQSTPHFPLELSISQKNFDLTMSMWAFENISCMILDVLFCSFLSCYSCPINTAFPYRHVRNGTSCAEPHGQINCPADIVPNYKWEIATPTKFLEKACQKLRGIPEVPPQRITDLDNATRQLHQLSCTWIVARSQRAMKSVKHRKLSCICPAPKKDLTRLQQNIMSIYRNSLTKMSCKSTRTQSRLMIDKAHLRALWVAPERR